MKLALAGLASVSALVAALPAQAEMHFNRVGAFAVAQNLPEGVEPTEVTSAEIIAATEDGMTLIYTDSPLGAVGLIDITDPRAPKPLGSLDMAGEPTSVTVLWDTAFVAVNTSESFANPSGRLSTLDIPTREETASCDLGGQPDSIKIAKDGGFLAIAIENERDEDLNDGAIPQMPAGFVTLLPVADGTVDCAGLIKVDLTGLATIAPEDPEPEFVDINAAGEIVVTLQENNEIAILDQTGKVLTHFSAGSVDLEGIDTLDDGALIFTGTETGRLREPDAVKWIDANHFATANEGDYEGGSRGFSIFNRDGTATWDSGNSFERAIAEIGHYPDSRSDAKGVEPEGLEFARFGDTDLLFVLAERASVAGVYGTADGTPTLLQVLPSGISPEGAVAIPARGLFATANETDLVEDGGARSHVMLYEWQDAPAAYPSITSAGTPELIGWGALSGLAADPTAPGMLYAVNDSVYGAQPSIFAIDATAVPARITGVTRITRAGAPAQKLDIEGITTDGDGGFWLASEGRTDRLIPDALYHVGADGAIEDEIAFPAELIDGESRYGAEGIARVGDTLWVAMQREWADDPKGMVKLLAYNLETKEWRAVHYPLDATENGWTGLSEITAHDHTLYIIERDNLIGAAAGIKKLTRVTLDGVVPAPLGGPLPVVEKQTVHDFLPELTATGGYVVDKLEGFTIDASGAAFAVTDNDGVDDSSGETHFLPLGGLDAM